MNKRKRKYRTCYSHKRDNGFYEKIIIGTILCAIVAILIVVAVGSYADCTTTFRAPSRAPISLPKRQTVQPATTAKPAQQPYQASTVRREQPAPQPVVQQKSWFNTDKPIERRVIVKHVYSEPTPTFDSGRIMNAIMVGNMLDALQYRNGHEAEYKAMIAEEKLRAERENNEELKNKIKLMEDSVATEENEKSIEMVLPENGLQAGPKDSEVVKENSGQRYILGVFLLVASVIVVSVIIIKRK